MVLYACYMCTNKYAVLQDTVTHLKLEHFVKENKADQRIKCLKSIHCEKSYLTFKAMKDHTRKCRHIDIEIENEPILNQEQFRNDQPMVEDDALFEENLIRNQERNDDDRAGEIGDMPFDSQAAFKSIEIMMLAVLGCLTSLKLPATLKTAIFQQLESLVFSIHEYLKQYLISNIPDYVNSSTAEYIDLFFSNILIVMNKYRSGYAINQQLREKNHKYVSPVKRNIGARWDKVYNKNIGRYLEKFKLSEYYYVSLKDSINQLLENPDFRNQIQPDHICEEGVYRKFCCGAVYKNNTFFQENPNAIRIQIYYDDFKLTNSQNPNSIKIGAIYYTIENLPSILNSHINHIHLLSIFYTIDLKNFGVDFNTLLYPIVQEIKELQTGVLRLDIKANLASFTGDNLAIHTAFGFFENFAFDFYCQHCTMTKVECDVSTREDPTRLRNSEQYNQLFEGNKSKEFPHMNSAHGIKRYTFLNDIDNFDIARNMVVDCMHDIAELTIPRTLKIFFEKAIRFKIITLDQINERLIAFDYGFKNEKNKPGEVNLSNENTLGLNAMQSIIFIQHIPFLFPELVSDERMKIYWYTVRDLICITKICLLRVINEKDLQDLEAYIESYLQGFLQHFEGYLKPKQHFLIHYPRIIRNCGPPTTMWTMRYEQIHQIFKTIYASSKNSINVCKTLSQRYQEYTSLNNIEYAYTDWKRSKERVLSARQRTLLPAEYRFTKELRFVSRTNIHIRDNVFFILRTFDNCAHLARIEHIYVTEGNDVYLQHSFYHTVGFNDNYACYEIVRTEGVDIAYEKLEDWPIETTYKAFKIDDKEFILLMKLNFP